MKIHPTRLDNKREPDCRLKPKENIAIDFLCSSRNSKIGMVRQSSYEEPSK